MLNLTTEKRDLFGKRLKPLRRGGKLPVVIYGGKEKNQSLSVSSIDFKKVWERAGESTIITLKTPLGDKDALIQNVDIHPVSGIPVHADFYIVDTTKPIEVSIPLVFEGVAPAVKSLGGILVKVMHELKIEALPKELPHELKIDLEKLVDFDSHIAVKDVELPEGAKALDNPDEIVASISEPKEEEETVEEVDLSAVEVEKKGKEDAGDDKPEEKTDDASDKKE